MINSLGNTGAILILLAGAILLEHIVAWAGSILHSVPSFGESRYAVFTLRDDQDKPMTTNILMNILIPNVAMIFIYIWASHFALEYILENTVFCHLLFCIQIFVNMRIVAAERTFSDWLRVFDRRCGDRDCIYIESIFLCE